MIQSPINTAGSSESSFIFDVTYKSEQLFQSHMTSF